MVQLSGGFRGAGNAASLGITDAPVHKMQLHQAINSIYFLSNLVGVVLKYLGWSVWGVNRVVNSVGWSTQWGITLVIWLISSCESLSMMIGYFFGSEQLMFVQESGCEARKTIEPGESSYGQRSVLRRNQNLTSASGTVSQTES
jgi:hypothetical protein